MIIGYNVFVSWVSLGIIIHIVILYDFHKNIIQYRYKKKLYSNQTIKKVSHDGGCLWGGRDSFVLLL